VGSTTITATVETFQGTAQIVVLGPIVTATSPDSGELDVRASSPVVVTFNQAMAPATITTQTASGSCTGTLQLSLNGFTTCVGFTATAVVMSAGNAVATARVALRLTKQATYQIRVLGTVSNAAGSPIGSDFTQSPGFTTSGACGDGLVISQIYGAGGSINALFKNDFIELHNRGAEPVSLAGRSVQYASTQGTTWQVTTLPSVVVPAGGYYLIQEGAGAGNGATLVPDLVPPVLILMGTAAGKVALTSSIVPLIGGCPIGLTDDFVGYGRSTDCFEGANPTNDLSAINAALRGSGGCTDADANLTDFAVATSTPRNHSTPDAVCTCQ
jgi:hypothetical protein